MALDGSSGYMAASSLADMTAPSLPMFSAKQVQLKFSIAADFVAAQVANDVLILALATGRILRIDLNNAEDIDGEQLACGRGRSPIQSCGNKNRLTS